MNIVKRSEVYYVDLNPVFGSEQQGVRPAVVIQNDVGNNFSSTTIVASITSKIKNSMLPTHVTVSSDIFKMRSFVMLEQIRTVDVRRLKEYLGILDNETMNKIDRAIGISLGLIDI